MKKLTLFVCFFLLLGMFGCQTPHIDESIPQGTDPAVTAEPTQEETAKPSEPQTEAPNEQLPETGGSNHQPNYSMIFRYKNIEEYLRETWEKKAKQNADAGLNSQNLTVSVVVPVLKRSDYEFLEVRDINPLGIECLKWTFAPVEREDGDRAEYAYVYVDLDLSAYDEVIGSEPDENGFILNPYGIWFFQVNGYTVSVELPESEGYSFIPNFSPEQIYKYFDFELVTYSPNTETHPVQ